MKKRRYYNQFDEITQLDLENKIHQDISSGQDVSTVKNELDNPNLITIKTLPTINQDELL